MHRRDFLQGMAATAAGLEMLARGVGASAQTRASITGRRRGKATTLVSLEGYTLVSEFKADGDSWKAYEDLKTREGPVVFVSSSGENRVLAKSAEAAMAEGT